MTIELSCAKKNGTNGNGNGNHEVGKPKPTSLPREDAWVIKRDMPRPQKKESRRDKATTI
jgi:hypothetical protein